LKGGFGFVEQEFGEYPVIGQVKDEVPLGYIAAC